MIGFMMFVNFVLTWVLVLMNMTAGQGLPQETTIMVLAVLCGLAIAGMYYLWNLVTSLQWENDVMKKALRKRGVSGTKKAPFHCAYCGQIESEWEESLGETDNE